MRVIIWKLLTTLVETKTIAMATLTIEFLQQVLAFMNDNPTHHNVYEIYQNLQKANADIKLIDVWLAVAKTTDDKYVEMQVIPAEGLMKQHTKEYPVYRIKYDGSLFYQNGGYVEQDRKDKEEKAWQIRKLKADTHNSERVFKTYPSTRIMAIVSFIFSGVLLFLAIASALKIWPYHTQAGITGHP